MSNSQHPIYWFNPVSGEIHLSQEELPAKKSRLYLVINRENLFFGAFALQSKKRVKDSNILNIQSHFIPFKSDFMNIIYSAEKREEKRFFSWVGHLTSTMDVNVESYFYDEIPESLMFKGDPGALRNYRLFVFKRVSGFEIIYFNGGTDDFYSIFEKDESKIVEKIILLTRKFSIGKGETVRMLADRDISSLHDFRRLMDDYSFNIDIDVIKSNENKYFFLPDFFPVKKKFSNLSQNKQMRSIKNIIRQWNRNLTIIMALLLVVILLNILGFIVFKQDNARFHEKFATIGKTLSAAETIEFNLNKIKRKIARYPDHLLYLKTISEALGLESSLIAYSLDEGKIIIEGYSTDSLGILTQLRKSNRFKEIRFKTTVTKNVYSQREKFEIEIILKEAKV